MTFQARSLCGQGQILGGTAQTCVQVVIVGIDSGTASRQVWQDRDPAGLEHKLPGLRIVAGRRESRVLDQYQIVRSITG